MVRTSPFHGENTGSNPVGFTNFNIGYGRMVELVDTLDLGSSD